MTAAGPLRDPVCGMAVDPARAREMGLLVELDGRTYAFCRDGCRRVFLAEPAAYAEAAAGPGGAAGAAAAGTATPDAIPAASATPVVIDEGMRRWYEACSCCLGDTYPEVKAALDEERRATQVPPVGPGICEVAEA